MTAGLTGGVEKRKPGGGRLEYNQVQLGGGQVPDAPLTSHSLVDVYEHIGCNVFVRTLCCRYNTNIPYSWMASINKYPVTINTPAGWVS